MSGDGQINQVRLKGDLTGLQQYYNAPSCSDVKLKLPNSFDVIYAHKVILKAGSGLFSRRHGQEGEAAEWQVDEKYSDALKVGIRYMYGFEFPCDVRNWDFGDISSLAEIGAVAEKYEIRGLSECVLKAARRTLAEFLGDDSAEDRLEEFLLGFQYTSSPHFGSSQEFDFAVKILGEHIDVLHNKAAFQELLREEHDLAVEMFNILAKRQSQMQGGNEDVV